MRKILTIAGSDSGGGAGIQADLKTITALGGYGMSILTSITAQNTLGVQGVFNLPMDFLEMEFDSIFSDFEVDAAKTGMLGNKEIIQTVVKKVKEYQVKRLVVDPVMVATSGDVLLEEEALESLKKELIPCAYLITPNLEEARIISGMEIKTVEEMKEAAVKIRELGAKNVLIKGGHLENQAIDVLFDGKEFFEFQKERVDSENTHGTGCTLSAALATFIGNGDSVYDAVAKSKEYITRAILASSKIKIGKGNGPVIHNYYFNDKVGEHIGL